MSRKFASLFAAITIAAASIAPAMAEPIVQQNSVRISYADLDLSRVEGVKTLSVRIDRAADKVCGSLSGRMQLAQVKRIKQCRAQTVEKTVAAINTPLLNAMMKSGKVA